MQQLKREIEAGFAHFEAVHGPIEPPRKFVIKATKQATPLEIARAYLAIPDPERGALRLMCDGCGLKYANVYSVVVKLRKERALKAA